MPAEETAAATDGERDDDAVADFEIADVLAHFDYLAHKFVAQNVALFHPGDVAVVDMEIGPADRRGRRFDESVALVQELRLRNIFHAYVMRAVPAECLHRCLLQSPRGC